MSATFPSIFLSHATQDNYAGMLQMCLRNNGRIGHVWFDAQNIQAGDIWAQAIVDAIRSCDVFVVFIPYKFSQNVADECRIALTLGKRILPFYRESVDNLRPYNLSHIQGMKINEEILQCNVIFSTVYPSHPEILNDSPFKEIAIKYPEARNYDVILVDAILHLASNH